MYRLGGVAVDVETVDETLVLPLQGLTPDAIDLIAAEAEGQGATVAMDEPSASGVLAITHPPPSAWSSRASPGPGVE
jgi:hypothetical protein